MDRGYWGGQDLILITLDQYERFSVFHHLRKDKQRKQRHSLKLGKKRRESSKRNYYIISPRVIMKAIIYMWWYCVSTLSYFLLPIQCCCTFTFPELTILQWCISFEGTPNCSKPNYLLPCLLFAHVVLFVCSVTSVGMAGTTSRCARKGRGLVRVISLRYIKPERYEPFTSRFSFTYIATRLL